VLVRDLDAARRLAVVDDAEAAQLTSPARPVVLLRARPDSTLSPLVAPGNPLVGVMLPHTPIQHLLSPTGCRRWS
jgi:hydrogenase maturation protein HypF